MRYRDVASIVISAVITIWLGLYGKATVESMFYDSRAINRDDARSVQSTLITSDAWVDFQILNNATTVRLLTNAALQSVDAPDHDLTNPRLGWRYTIEYQLLDAGRNVVDAADYHFRTQIRQLKDAETGESMYPIFLGKSGLVSAQTRPMQLAIDHLSSRPVILRVRLKSADEGIKEVVGRSLSRIERPDFDKRYTWNRLSKLRRELICRYTVYEPDLLTTGERTNLLRWRWAQTSTISDSQRRQLFFIGGFDDHEVRGEQLPIGLFADPNWFATIPVPEGKGQVRLEFVAVDPLPEETPQIEIRWYGVQAADRLVRQHALIHETTGLMLGLDGGLIQIKSPVRVVVRAFWTSTLANDGEIVETEITPAPVLSKNYVIDDQAIGFSITHIDDQPTPLRLTLRYPFGPNFGNAVITSTDDPAVSMLGTINAVWEFLDEAGSVLDSGILPLEPVVSHYDNLELATGAEWLSEKCDYYFAVRPGIKRVRVRSPDCRLLLSAAVRPPGLRRVTQVPEDYHAYQRRMSLNRTWYALNPPNDRELVQGNRTFILRMNNRPPENDEQIMAGNYQWQSFHPRGQWIGRQMLVPQGLEINVRDRAVSMVYFELDSKKDYAFTSFNAQATELPGRLIVISDESPGKVVLKVDGEQVYSKHIRSARGEIDLSQVALPSNGTISLTAGNESRFFFGGRRIEGAEHYLKRTAQRLGDSPLEFEYEKKSHDEELLTVKVYRGPGEGDRLQLRVRINPVDRIERGPGPVQSWTTLDRTYDLRPHHDQGSLLIGHRTRVDVGHRCYIRLGQELPPGRYRVTVERTGAGLEGYVLMYQTLPGEKPQRNIKVNAVPKRKNAS